MILAQVILLNHLHFKFSSL